MERNMAYSARRFTIMKVEILLDDAKTLSAPFIFSTVDQESGKDYSYAM
jgi:hypothetical protein